MAEDLLGQIGKKGTRAAKRSVLQSPSVAQEKERRESYDSHPVAPLALLYLDKKVPNLFIMEPDRKLLPWSERCEEILSPGLPFRVDHWRFLQQIGQSNTMGPQGTTAIDVACRLGPTQPCPGSNSVDTAECLFYFPLLLRHYNMIHERSSLPNALGRSEMSCEGNVSTCTGEQQVTSRFPPAPMSITFSDCSSQYSNRSTCIF